MSYACPSCGETDQIDVDAVIRVRLVQTGDALETDANSAEDQSHDFDDSNMARCCDCGHTEQLSAFSTEDEDDDDDDDDDDDED